MLAAENGGLPGGKVGGLGDVIRELPRSLARFGHRVTVMTPSYRFLARLPGARRVGSISVPFAGFTETVDRLEVPSGVANVDYELLDHPRFAPGGHERIYHDDHAGAPFATDAAKFAFFSAAAGRLIADLETKPDVLHLHDWHTGLVFLLRRFDSRYRALQKIRSVFTIHNLAIQGTRPLDGVESSLKRWYPRLDVPPAVVADPRYPGCVNPLAVGIRLADFVSTVSPTYAREILLPSDERRGRHGGEFLEALLRERNDDGVLAGILNGCEYPDTSPPAPTYETLLGLIEEELKLWIASSEHVDSAAYLALERLAELPGERPPVIATSVGRVSEQKLGLFRQRVGTAATALERVLKALDEGLLIMLGSGDSDYERFLEQAEVRCPNLLYVRGFSERIAQALYAIGDLFLMPSVFEPCGISQMLAMRAGQPCVAHAVGGLKDTVTAANGFPFEGDTPRQQAQNFAREVAAAVDLKAASPEKWRALTAAARAERFTWEAGARRYLDEVYAVDAGARR
jgi:starch synthase